MVLVWNDVVTRVHPHRALQPIRLRRVCKARPPCTKNVTRAAS